MPLFISIAAAVYQPHQPFRTKAELLEKYIDRQLALDTRVSDRRRRELQNRPWAYKTPEQEPDWRITRHYLSWLASKLKENYQTELLIEHMQPSWLDTSRQKWLYRLIVGLIVGPIWGILGLIYVQKLGLILGLILSLIYGWNVGMDSIKLVEIFQIPLLYKARRKIRQSLGQGLIFGLILVLIFGPTFGLISTTIYGLIFGSILGLVLGLVLALQKELEIRARPNQGVRSSLQSMMFATVVGSPLMIMLMKFVDTALTVVEEQRIGAFIATAIVSFQSTLFSKSTFSSGVWMAIAFGFSLGGGLAFVQHFCLRFILARSQSAPWDYVAFLNYCVERRLLQRVGGRYRFIHRELLEHFARYS